MRTTILCTLALLVLLLAVTAVSSTEVAAQDDKQKYITFTTTYVRNKPCTDGVIFFIMGAGYHVTGTGDIREQCGFTWVEITGSPFKQGWVKEDELAKA